LCHILTDVGLNGSIQDGTILDWNMVS
jgi:hypothetical protein